MTGFRPLPSPAALRLASEARTRFVDGFEGTLHELGGRIGEQLAGLANAQQRAGIDRIRLAAEALPAFQRVRQTWLKQVWRGLREPSASGRAAAPPGRAPSQFSLLDDEAVEQGILASRLAAAIRDAAGEEVGHLQRRIQALEGTEEWGADDVLRPETLGRVLISAWVDGGLTRPMWGLVQEAAQAVLRRWARIAYSQANAFLVEHGVMAQIDLKALVRRDDDDRRDGLLPSPERAPGPFVFSTGAPGPSSLTGAPGPRSLTGAPVSSPRALTGVAPMGGARERGQGVLSQLRRLVRERVGGLGAPAVPQSGPSPRLARALAEVAVAFPVTELMELPAGARAVPMAGVDEAMLRLRQRTTELKAKTDQPNEKATIEIVALMFQALLTEERIPSSIRVWFARLQIPVLRLALAEPDFFASVDHPARELIDRMGACAMGFDAAGIAGSQLELEVKRVVQVIEQYPETGRRVFQLVLDEFKQFLGRTLTEGAATRQAATLAQQVEQKEALSIQYTIELRRMLASFPVVDEVREFLFRVWSEVLALAAVRQGAQHADMRRYKQAAADLLWAVSPKTERAERAQVLQSLSGLLRTLRQGMATLGLGGADQDEHIKRLNDAVMQAFVSRAEGISAARLEELARGLSNLEDVVTDDPEGDVLIDPEMIEFMFGIEGEPLEVIADGGVEPGQEALRWAGELQQGHWFRLDRHGVALQVQYAWRSERRQLHIFATADGRVFLVQTRRLAAYLQAGLLVPVEAEALTVRATREALARLSADPDQLLR